MSALTIAVGLSALTAILLCVVTAIWIDNYRTFKTPLALGLLAFCLVLLLENLVILYFYLFTEEMLFIDGSNVETLVVVMQVLEFLAVAIFTYVSLD